MFVDLKDEVGFRKVFVNDKNPKVLISFLNAVLELSSPIIKLKRICPLEAPRIKDLKDTSLDVKAVDKKGREFIVEMQVEGNDNFGKRATYYLAKSYAAQIKKAEQYNELKPAYFVGILDFNLFDGKKCITRHIIINQETQRQDLKDFEFNFIELKKFKKTEKELVSIIDKWIFFIKNAENIDIIPDSITESEILEAFNTAKQSNWTKKEMETYDYISMKKGDKIAQIMTAEKKGIKKGRKEGIKEGFEKGIKEEKKNSEMKIKEEKIKIAKNLLLAKQDFKFIIEMTGLSKKEIENIQKGKE